MVLYNKLQYFKLVTIIAEAFGRNHNIKYKKNITNYITCKWNIRKNSKSHFGKKCQCRDVQFSNSAVATSATSIKLSYVAFVIDRKLMKW